MLPELTRFKPVTSPPSPDVATKSAPPSEKKPATNLEFVPCGPKPDLAACFSGPIAGPSGAKGGKPIAVGEVLGDFTVQAELARAWMDTLRDINPAQPDAKYQTVVKAKEEGGWVYAAEQPGVGPKFVVVRAPHSDQGNEISLDPVPRMPGFKPVATFHTHPESGLPGKTLGPSTNDLQNAHDRGLPGIVVGMGGALSYGPKVAK